MTAQNFVRRPRRAIDDGFENFVRGNSDVHRLDQRLND